MNYLTRKVEKEKLPRDRRFTLPVEDVVWK